MFNFNQSHTALSCMPHAPFSENQLLEVGVSLVIKHSQHLGSPTTSMHCCIQHTQIYLPFLPFHLETPSSCCWSRCCSEGISGTTTGDCSPANAAANVFACYWQLNLVVAAVGAYKRVTALLALWVPATISRTRWLHSFSPCFPSFHSSWKPGALGRGEGGGGGKRVVCQKIQH